MKVKCNYHTHTVRCDGVNTAEEIILTAIEKGFDIIGVSGHSHTSFDESYCMSHEEAMAYRKELLGLKEKYRERITVLAGLEYDYYSDEVTEGWDYLVRSVHYIKAKGRYLPVDESWEITRSIIDEDFGGDAYAYAECYYETVSEIASKVKTGTRNIIGHFDLITKFNDKKPMFDTTHPRYVEAYRRALDALVPLGAPFEINSNAVLKGYRNLPYPSDDILRDIRERGGKIILSSDAHDRDYLDYYFDEMEDIARAAGFTKRSVFTADGEVEVEL